MPGQMKERPPGPDIRLFGFYVFLLITQQGSQLECKIHHQIFRKEHESLKGHQGAFTKMPSLVYSASMQFYLINCRAKQINSFHQQLDLGTR